MESLLKHPFIFQFFFRFSQQQNNSKALSKMFSFICKMLARYAQMCYFTQFTISCWHKVQNPGFIFLKNLDLAKYIVHIHFNLSITTTGNKCEDIIKELVFILFTEDLSKLTNHLYSTLPYHTHKNLTGCV